MKKQQQQQNQEKLVQVKDMVSPTMKGEDPTLASQTCPDFVLQHIFSLTLADVKPCFQIIELLNLQKIKLKKYEQGF